MLKIHDLIDRIHVISNEQDCDSFIRSLKPSAAAKTVRVAFVNAHALNLAFTNDGFLNDLMACDYILRDGSGMKILFRMLGREPGLNMNGTDLIPRIIDIYKGQDIALLGTDAPYLDKAAQVIKGRGLNPTIVMNGFHETQLYVDALKTKPVPLIVLAMGMPKQEHVAATLVSSIGNPSLILCGGAILDFIGGKVARAPEIYRKFGAEWVYRLAQEPRRLFRRYVIGNIVFLYRAFLLSRSGKKTDRGTQTMKNLHVLHVVRQFAPAIGGLESYVYNMVKHQQKHGYTCEVLTLNKVFHGGVGELPAQDMIDGIPVRRVSFHGRRRFFLPMIAPSYFGKFDLVHVHNTDMFYDYGALVAATSKTPFFATTHGGFFHTADFSLIKKIYFNTITRFSSVFYKAIFAISQNDFDTFKGLNKNIVLQHNAIEPLGDAISTGKDFLYIGRLAQHKNVARVIEVFAHLKSNHGVEGKLHIVGPEWDVTIADLKATAEKNNISDQVIFHGAATTAQMRDIASSCGYFVSASSFEGFGMSMLEGMSMGLIPLVQENESFRELVTQSGIGVCTDYRDISRAEKDILQTMASATTEKREKARAFSLKFSWDELVTTTDRIYKDYIR